LFGRCSDLALLLTNLHLEIGSFGQWNYLLDIENQFWTQTTGTHSHTAYLEVALIKPKHGGSHAGAEIGGL